MPADTGEPKGRFWRITTAGVFFQGGAAAVDTSTIVAALVHGMNIDHMPELGWLLGYPFALFLMVLSAILPYLWFKTKGWL